jgi:integrase
MASAFKRGKKFVLKWKDQSGRWRSRTSSAKGQKEADRLAWELEMKCERQRIGLEPRARVDEVPTLGELLSKWIEGPFKYTESFDRTIGTIRRHLLESELASLPLSEVGTKVETFLKAKERERCSATANHLRGYLNQAYRWANRAGVYTGPNPITQVKKFKVQRRVGDYLRANEVARVIAAIPERHRNRFVAAVYTGLRLGELASLKKSDVDLDARLLTVARSWSRDTTKGGHADVIPIANELAPYLHSAIDASKSELVFPRPNGSKMRRGAQLSPVLRSALRRAGIVSGYRHSCRRKGCGHVEKAPEDHLRRCPKCNMKLWPVGEVRKIRFHDLRHTTASLLMMAGANPAAVQRILRHADPKITTEVYGHLAPGYLKDEVNRMSFGLLPPAQNDNGAGTTVGGCTTIAPKSLLEAAKACDDWKPPASAKRVVQNGCDDLRTAAMGVSRLWDQDVGGSNPLAPTRFFCR